jgi:ABC-type branched-subunit amino acid transport system substrate-binding protein
LKPRNGVEFAVEEINKAGGPCKQGNFAEGLVRFERCGRAFAKQAFALIRLRVSRS